MKASGENAVKKLTIKRIYEIANYVIEHYRLTEPEKDGVKKLARALEYDAVSHVEEATLH